MKKSICLVALTVILVLTTCLVSFSCVRIVKVGQETQTDTSTTKTVPVSPPQIISFKASAMEILPGETVNLTWKVSGATSVSIMPEPGKVQEAGSVTVRPQSTVTYRLTAENSAGSASESLTVKVLTQVAKADLIVDRIFIQANQLYFDVINAGTVPSALCQAELYVNGVKFTGGETAITPLAPGQKQTFNFGRYTYQMPTYTEEYLSTQELLQEELKVCVDVENVVVEMDEVNNCRTIVLGPRWDYSFYNVAHLAKWFTGAGELTWPVPQGGNLGSAFTAVSMVLEGGQSGNNVIVAYPQPVAQGWISASFAEFYTDEMRKTQVRLLKLPRHVRFKAAVGLTREADPMSQAKVSFTLLDQSYTPVYKKELTVRNDGMLDYLDEDLSEFAGKSCSMVIRVDSMGVPGKDGVAWLNPILTQEW